tara:strand:- start:9349 stop:10542 length:1194 start_codon:yes stop_codon:yes gene_type:complete
MSHVWWKILVRKAPLFDRVDRNRQLLEHLRSTGQDPEPTRLRQTNMGQEQKKVKKPTSAVGQEVGYSFPRLNNPNLTGSPFSDRKFSGSMNSNFTHFYESPDKKVRAGIKHLGDNRYAVDHYGVREDEQEAGVGREGLNQLRRELEAHHGGPVEMTPTDITPSSQGFWDKMQSENITNMLKEAKSPKALAHKRKYETEYESSPARKKYRRELEGERRKRGVAGKGGGDMSHTKTGKIVVEDPHTNRARSHPSVGSTLKMVVVKAPQMNLDGQSAECELCGTAVDAQTAQMMNEQFGATVCMGCIQQEQEQVNQQNDMMYHSEPMEIAMRLLKEQKQLFVQGQKTLDGRPAFAPTDFAAEEQRRQAALKEQRARESREAQRRKNAEGLTPLPFQQNPE